MREQRWFLNLVAEFQTELFPKQLLHRIGKVERELGRKRTVRNGPRTIDIDILLYGNAVVKTEALEIPHPRYRERRFTLAPLAELNPELRDPVTRRTMAEMLAALKDQAIRKKKLTRSRSHLSPRLSGYEISQLIEQRAQTGFESPPALNRSAEQGLAHLHGARGVNRPARLVEAETAIVPPQAAVIDQTPGLPFEIVNHVFIDDVEHGIGRAVPSASDSSVRCSRGNSGPVRAGRS